MLAYFMSRINALLVDVNDVLPQYLLMELKFWYHLTR